LINKRNEKGEYRKKRWDLSKKKEKRKRKWREGRKKDIPRRAIRGKVGKGGQKEIKNRLWRDRVKDRKERHSRKG